MLKHFYDVHIRVNHLVYSKDTLKTTKKKKKTTLLST